MRVILQLKHVTLVLVSTIALWSFASYSHAATWVAEVVPADVGTSSQSDPNKNANGCYTLRLRLQGANLSGNRTFSLGTTYISPHTTGCSQYTESPVLADGQDTLTLELHSPFETGTPQYAKNITIQAAHGVDQISIDFPNSGTGNTTTTTTSTSPQVGEWPIINNIKICDVQAQVDGIVLVQPCGGWTAQSSNSAGDACNNGLVQWIANAGSGGGQAVSAIATAALLSGNAVTIGVSGCTGAFEDVSFIKLNHEPPESNPEL